MAGSGTEAVGLADTASLTEHSHYQPLSAVGCQVTATSSSCWGQEALSNVICALMSPVSQL